MYIYINEYMFIRITLPLKPLFPEQRSRLVSLYDLG
jgi:hypothetical protein